MFGIWEMLIIGLVIGLIAVPYVRQLGEEKREKRFPKEDVIELDENSYEIHDD